jgi:uncharacterized membrane protein YfcA
MIDINLILLPFVGFLIGLLVTTLGGGGGALYVPVLTLFFGIAPQVAVATSLATVLPTTAVGALGHHRLGHVDVRTGVILGVGGILGTLIGAYFANQIPGDILKKALGVLLLIMIIPMLRRALQGLKKQKDDKTEVKESLKLTGTRRIIASFFGVLSGILAGVFGLSGTPPVTAGLYSLGLPAVIVVGTTVFVLVFNSVAGVAGYLVLGRFDLTLTLLLGSGAVCGALIGPRLFERIGQDVFEKILPPIFMIISIVFGLSLILT